MVVNVAITGENSEACISIVFCKQGVSSVNICYRCVISKNDIGPKNGIDTKNGIDPKKDIYSKEDMNV